MLEWVKEIMGCIERNLLGLKEIVRLFCNWVIMSRDDILSVCGRDFAQYNV